MLFNKLRPLMLPQIVEMGRIQSCSLWIKFRSQSTVRRASYLAGIVCFDGVLPVGVSGVRVRGWAPCGQQPIAQIDRLLILWGGWRWGGAEVQRNTQPILCHLPVKGPTIWGVPSHSQHLRRGQGREPVGAAVLRGVVICKRRRRSKMSCVDDCDCLCGSVYCSVCVTGYSRAGGVTTGEGASCLMVCFVKLLRKWFQGQLSK